MTNKTKEREEEEDQRIETWSLILSDPSGLPEGGTLSGASGTGIYGYSFVGLESPLDTTYR